MPYHKRIPRSDRSPIEKDLEAGPGSRKQTMKDHGEMGIDAIDQITEIGRAITRGHNPIKRLPQNQCARRLRGQSLHERL